MATRQRVIRKVGTFGRHIRNGFVRTTTGGAWLYMLLPSQPPVRDAATWEQREQAARPILTILQALAERTPHLTLAGRKANKALYRQIHILAVSASIPFEPSRTLDPDTRVRLAVEQHDLIVHQRFTLFGVRLNSSLPKGAHRVLETVQRILQPVEYEPDEAFADDRETIGRILRSAGCTTPDETVMRRAFSWWPSGNDQEGISVLIEHGHMHTFPGHRQAELGARIHDRIVDCDSWAERIHGSYPMTVCTLGALPWQGADERTAEGADWASRMLTLPAAGGQGAVALSVRGLVEPGELSREQIDKDKQKVLDKAIEQAQTGYKQNVKTAQDLNLASDVYGMDGRPWPTLVETHTHVAVPRIVDEPRSLGYPGAVEMNYDRQFHAWEDMQIGAEGMLEYDPSPCYWPAPILAYAGLNGRSFTGDDTGQNRDSDLPGALVGASEADAQPVYDSPFAASKRSGRCISLGLGSTGSGKTRLALHLAGQWGRLPAPDHPGHTIPVVFWDPKPNSDDFGPFVRSRSGRFTRLDDPSSRGILDPLRCIPDTMRDMQMQMAVAMLGQITGGMHGDRNRELALTSIIGYGMRHGADCLGECVDMAYAEYVGHGPEAGTIAPLVTDIKPMLDRAVLNDPLMPLIYATEHGGAKLSVGEGLTLISAGSLNVITEKEIDSAPSAVQRWVCRMVAIGASSLVIGRDGMFVGDEAWSLLLDDFGRSVVARMGRLGRAQHYMAFLLSQKVDEFVDAGLDDFIGKVYVMAIGAKNEGSGRDSQAEAACRLAGQPLDGRMHARMMHDKYVDPDSRAPDWDSLYALRDPDTGRLLRGSIAYLSTGGGAPAIPVEVRVPDTLV